MANKIGEPVRTFKVLHGAVAGVTRNKKGDLVDIDYFAGRIVREDQLEGNASEYVALGAIAPIELPEPEAEQSGEPVQE